MGKRAPVKQTGKKQSEKKDPEEWQTLAAPKETTEQDRIRQLQHNHDSKLAALMLKERQERQQRMESQSKEQRAEEARENARRGAFRFSQVGIAPGERVVFIENESIQPIVVDDRHIEYDGQTTSLSALAQQIKGFNHPVQGTLWFTYKGVKLTELREQMEKSDLKKLC